MTLTLLVGDRIWESVSLRDRDKCKTSLNFVLWKGFYLPCLYTSLAFTTETSRPVSFAVSMENCLCSFYLRQEKALIKMLLQLLFWEAVPLTRRSGTIVEIAILRFPVLFKIFYRGCVWRSEKGLRCQIPMTCNSHPVTPFSFRLCRWQKFDC